MSFDPLRHHPRVRRIAPWIVWAVVLGVVLWLAPGLGAVGVVAASVEVRQVTLVAPRTARVLRAAVRPGDQVEAGAVVMELDPSGVDLELAIAQVELERLRQAVVARELDFRGSDLQSAARLAQEAERAAVEVALLVSEEKRARAELAQLDELIARQQVLVGQRLASGSQRDELKLQRASVAQRVLESAGLIKTARDHERAARQRLQTWRESGIAPQGSIGAERAARARDSASDAALDERLAPERAEVAAQEERLRQLELARAALLLRAPIAGRISDVLVGTGDTATADAPVAVVVDDHPRTVIAWVDERAARRVQVGGSVSLKPSDRSASATSGTVRALGPLIAELPARFRPVPTQPAFARAVFIELEHGAPSPLPGQAFDVMFLVSP